jgi:hypothetical protein
VLFRFFHFLYNIKFSCKVTTFSLIWTAITFSLNYFTL